MPPPGAGSSSALLDRVKMFLPQMEKVRVRSSLAVLDSTRVLRPMMPRDGCLARALWWLPCTPPQHMSVLTLLTSSPPFYPTQANAELERRIQQEGAAAVQIDSNLGAEGGDTEEQEEEQEEEEEQEDQETERSGSTSTGNSQALNTGVFAPRSPPVTAAATSLKHDRGIANTTSIRNSDEKGKGEQTVQLEFVLGDVDATPIALAEAHAEQQILLEAAAEEELLRRQERGDEEE